MKRSLDIALRYGVATLAVGVALLIKLLLDPLTVQDTPFLLVFSAIIVSAWYGGLGPGVMATGLSVLATDYFFLYPRGLFSGGAEERRVGEECRFWWGPYPYKKKNNRI